MALMIGFILVAAFLAYQISLIASGTTTNETFKWQEVAEAERERQDALRLAQEEQKR